MFVTLSTSTSTIYNNVNKMQREVEILKNPAQKFNMKMQNRKGDGDDEK